ncbi:MAG TPA: SAM-dependent methyltransferase [Candidatus Altiarchaeales archaeon]|nr:SAM-dependent methyltransferase [Candidatus Altiarchaeales archaeon]
MIKLAYDVGEYRKLLGETVSEGDVVVEIGPHVGKSTRAYMDRASKIFLIDKGSDCEKALEKLAGENEKVTFIKEDARGFGAVKKVLARVKTCDVLAVDMGGGRYPDTVFKVWATWSGVFQPRHSVIRNIGLIEFVGRAKVEDEKSREKFPDSGWLSQYGRKTPYKLKMQLDEFSHWININEPLV